MGPSGKILGPGVLVAAALFQLISVHPDDPNPTPPPFHAFPTNALHCPKILRVMGGECSS